MHLGHECVLITKQFVGRNFICLVGVWKENEKGVVVVNNLTKCLFNKGLIAYHVSSCV